MSIDLSQFHQIFFEESFEGLDSMEQELLALSPGSEDLESINTIFRAAHSIKGGSGTFGFMQIADFTHVLESLLDDMRTGEREVTSESIDCLLKTVDVLRNMLSALQAEDEIDENEKVSCQMQLEKILNNSSESESSSDEQQLTNVTELPQSTENSTQSSGWKIKFIPEQHILMTGNEPGRLFRELAELGELTVECHSEKIPELAQLNPEQLFLYWTLVIETDSGIDEIKEVFEWVEDDCKLEITALQPSESEANSKNDGDKLDNKPAIENNNETNLAVTPITAKTAVAKQSVKKPPPQSRSIRVDISKVDGLINRVGELVITQSMLAELGENITQESVEKLRVGLAELEQNTRELQESVMSIRMMPISFAFNRFPRLVRDVCGQIGKEVDLEISGETTELDKTVMEQISDPLVHIVRNSLDHGFEMPQQRIDKGKPSTGKLLLNAYHQGGEIVIEISDDGKGLNREKIIQKAISKGLVDADQQLEDEEVWQLIFLPGFSTADQVSELSGRGVGMDVVKKNITSLGGSVEVQSAADVGTSLKIRLPLTLAILDGQLIDISGQIFIVPLIAMIESLPLDPASIKTFGRKGEMYKLRDKYIPIIDLSKEFCVSGDVIKREDKLLLVVVADGIEMGLLIDDLLAQQQVVIKSLDTNYKKITGISGATILGNGSIALIVDVAGLQNRKKKQDNKVRHQTDEKAA